MDRRYDDNAYPYRDEDRYRYQDESGYRDGRDSRYRRYGSRRRRLRRLHDQQNALDWIGDVLKVVLVILVILFCISMSHQAYEIGYNIFHQESMAPEGEGEDVEVTITDGMSVDEIGQLLQEKGLLKDGSLFRYQERFSSWHGKIVPGTYTLSTDMTPDDMLKVLSADYQDDSSTESTTESTGDSSSEGTADTVTGNE